MKPGHSAARTTMNRRRRCKADTERERQPAEQTPGRPKDSGSRQQHHDSQLSQSGSPQLDEELTENTKKKRR